MLLLYLVWVFCLSPEDTALTRLTSPAEINYNYINEISRGPTVVPAREDRFPGFWVISPEIPLHQEDRVYSGPCAPLVGVW